MVPPNSKSPDFDVPESSTRTNDGEEFLMYDATHAKLGGRLMIFSTKVLIEMLCASEVILIDGTFKTRPIMFISGVHVVMGKQLEEGTCVLFNQFLMYFFTCAFLFTSSDSSGLLSHLEENGRCIQTHLQSAQEEGRRFRLPADTATRLPGFWNQYYECSGKNGRFE